MGSIYITTDKGTLGLPDGRTMTLNGIGNYAQLSDGQQAYVGGYGYIGYPDVITKATSTAFTINGSTAQQNLIGLPHAIALSAVVTFVSGPTLPAETVKFMAQRTDVVGNPFQFDTATLSGSAPYTASDPAYSVSTPTFALGGTYNVWAVYPGDTNNATSKSNIVVLSISAG